MAALKSHGFTPIDLVCVNLYPFQKTIARPGVSRDEAIEQIDIGGPAMIRSASKNFESVTVLTSPADYASVAEEITRTGGTSLATRSRLAASAFEHTARYDAAIAAYLAQAAPSHDATHNLFPPVLDLHFVKADELRYGENPHQPAAIYRTPGRSIEGTIPGAEQLHGKELSYNNIADGASALALVQALSASFEGACAAVIKHNNPCGASARARSAAGAIPSRPSAEFSRSRRPSTSPPPRPSPRRGGSLKCSSRRATAAPRSLACRPARPTCASSRRA
jgi:phosphoribosylaminoimidazolecarboxamide formyltransferase/IMP cyclohydrolase